MNESTARAGWELLHLSRAGLASLEDTTTRVVAAQSAGLIALWTQLYTFDDSWPRALAWTAWAVLILSLSVLAWLVTPRRLANFWEGIVLTHVPTAKTELDSVAEVAMIERLSETMRGQIYRLRRGLRASISLGMLALALAALAYLLEKA